MLRCQGRHSGTLLVFVFLYVMHMFSSRAAIRTTYCYWSALLREPEACPLERKDGEREAVCIAVECRMKTISLHHMLDYLEFTTYNSWENIQTMKKA